MSSQAKEKSRDRNTKDKDILDLDNEIIIGIKSLPEVSKKSKVRAKESKKNKKRQVKKKTKKINKQRIKNNTSLVNEQQVEKKSKLTNKQQVKNNPSLTNNQQFGRKPMVTNKQAKNKPKLTKKQQEIAKKKRKIIFRLVKWTSLIVLLIGGGIYFLLSPFFNIKNITILGNEKIAQGTIISLSGIELEQNTFKISKGKAIQSIKTNAYIDSVKIKRKLPETIEIQVVERKVAYMLTLGNAYVYMNKQGYLLEISQEKLNRPIITGIVTPEEQIQEGNRLDTEDLQKLSNVIQIMDSATNNDIGNLITKINISDKQNYILELKSEKKNVYLGDTSNLSTKMLYIKEVIKDTKKKEGDIFVNTDLSNKGAVFREKV